MCAFAPPGRGYAYGDTIPILINLWPQGPLPLTARRSSHSSFPGDPSPRALHRIAHHRAPLLEHDPVQVLAEGPVSSVRSRRAIRDGPPQRRTVGTRELGPRRPDQVRVVSVTGTGLGDVK